MIYLDHAAATPVDKRALEAMQPYNTEKFFNPSAAYLPAKQVAAEYTAAKAEIAHAIGAKANDLIMTAGATEANNLAFSVVENLRNNGVAEAPKSPKDGRANESLESNYTPKVLYLATEHDSVRRVAEKFAHAEIAVDATGRIDLADLTSKLDDDVVLVSVALVNNELGTIQPLAEVATILQAARVERLRRGVKRPLYLHSDASQALNLLEVNVARLGVDLMSLNAAKVYGPKGVGALYVGHGVRLAPVSYGGGQERGLRAGTENVPGVIGFAKAVEIAREHLNGNRKKYARLKQILLSELQGYELINRGRVLDNFVVLCYNGIDAERLVFLLEEQGVYVATGAACAASKGVRSHVLAAIGLSDEQIAGSLRLTLGETNDEAQMHEAARVINAVVAEERRRLER